MEVLNRVEFAYGSLEEAFPTVDPLVKPFGSRVLVQIRSPKKVTKGGVIIPTDARDTEFWAAQVAIVRAVGPNAFRDRKTNLPWPEGVWAEIGDFVRVPKFGGDRWTVKVPKADGTKTSVYDNDASYEALFVIFNDTELTGGITGDPLAIKTYL